MKFFCVCLKSPSEPKAPPPSGCHTAMLTIALGRSPLDERSADRRDLLPDNTQRFLSCDTNYVVS